MATLTSEEKLAAIQERREHPPSDAQRKVLTILDKMERQLLQGDISSLYSDLVELRKAIMTVKE